MGLISPTFADMRILTTLFILIFLNAGTWAQVIENLDPTVHIVGGEPFFIHIVAQGQNISAVSEAYAADPTQIRLNNKALNEPLSEGDSVRIPVSERSIDAMQKHLEIRIMKERMVTKRLRTAAKNSQNKNDSVAMSKSEMMALEALSGALRETLANLQSAEKTIQEKPMADSNGFPLAGGHVPDDGQTTIIKKTPLSALVRLVSDSLTQDSREGFILREYFLVRSDKNGVITNVRDERTSTNSNTNFINPDRLVGYVINDTAQRLYGKIVALGLNAEAVKTHYDLKVKSLGKVKIAVEGHRKSKLSESHPHYHEIIAFLRSAEASGELKITVINTREWISIHDQYEYNPFALILERLDERIYARVYER